MLAPIDQKITFLKHLSIFTKFFVVNPIHNFPAFYSSTKYGQVE